MDKASLHGMWSSRLAFILAATGSAVGLGNIWRFPYMTSDNGGGAFVLIYLACILAVGLPILMAEIVIGRRGRMSPINTLEKVASESGANRAWVGVGWIGIIAGILILSFYSVVAGWTLSYSWSYLMQLIGQADPISEPAATFGALLGDAWALTGWHALFMVMTLGVVALGVEKGLERAVKLLMPALLLLLLILLGYGISTGHFGAALSFLFKPDFSEIDRGVFLAAMGQAFFSLSLGMCTMMAYGAYLPRNVSIGRVGVAVVFADTSVALLAGLAIFPIVIAFGLDPAGGGPGLIFNSLPLAFNAMGVAYGLAFFVLLSVAAWTSSISLMEPATAFLVEKTGLRRRGAAMVLGLLAWALGLVSLLGFNHWSHVRLWGLDIMDFVAKIANDIMLPLGGLLIALFAGWALKRSIARDELSDLPEWLFNAWQWLLRVVAPALVLVVLIRAIW